MMTGIGTPSSQSKMPRPMAVSSCWSCWRFCRSNQRRDVSFPATARIVAPRAEAPATRDLRRREATRGSSCRRCERPPFAQPLLRKPAETPLIVSWMPVSTLSLVERLRWIFSSST